MNIFTVELSVDLCNTVMAVFDTFDKAYNECKRREKIMLQELEFLMDSNNRELTEEDLKPHYEICKYEVK